MCWLGFLVMIKKLLWPCQRCYTELFLRQYTAQRWPVEEFFVIFAQPLSTTSSCFQLLCQSPACCHSSYWWLCLAHIRLLPARLISFLRHCPGRRWSFKQAIWLHGQVRTLRWLCCHSCYSRRGCGCWRAHPRLSWCVGLWFFYVTAPRLFLSAVAWCCLALSCQSWGSPRRTTHL